MQSILDEDLSTEREANSRAAGVGDEACDELVVILDPGTGVALWKINIFTDDMSDPFSVLIEDLGRRKVGEPLSIMVKDMIAVDPADLYPVAFDVVFFNLNHIIYERR